MNPVKYIRDGIIGLAMLASAAFGFDPSLRQTEVSGEYNYDSTHSGYVQVHQQLEDNDAFLRFEKGQALNLDAYLNLYKKHLLGQGSAFYEFRNNHEKDDKLNTHIVEAGHTLLDFDAVRNWLYLTYKNQSSETSEKWKDTLTLPGFVRYDQNNKNTNTNIQENEFYLDNNFFDIINLGIGKRKIKEKPDYRLETNSDMKYEGDDNIYHGDDIAYDTTKNTINITKVNTGLNLRNLNLSFMIKIINEKKAEVKSDSVIGQFTSYTNLYTDKRDLSGYITSLFLSGNYSFLRNIGFLASYGKKQGDLELHNDSWLPREAGGKSRLEDITGNINLMLGDNFLHNLDINYNTYFYDVKADSGILGLNPQGIHKDTKTIGVSYDLFIPFSRWDVDRLADAILFRHTEKRLEEQEDKTLRLNIPRRTHWLYTPITRSNLHLAFEREESNPIDERHETNTIEARLKHCVFDMNGIKLSPFYNLTASRTSSSYEDTSSTEPTETSSTTNSFGLEGIIKNKVIWLLKIKNDDSGWGFGIAGQIYFSPYKEEWSGK
ncbi:hypothetical protein KY345_01570 [Candidatus Woesearchaeota archaeon]|nr:hypothetical protein [Candidatus Woesearchaeota archaeon]